MSRIVEPHGGGALKPLLIPEARHAEELKRAGHLNKVPMSSREVSDVLMLAMGAYTPIDGFMGKNDWHGTCTDMTLSNGIFWPIPITLSAETSLAETIDENEEIALKPARIASGFLVHGCLCSGRIGRTEGAWINERQDNNSVVFLFYIVLVEVVVVVMLLIL